MANCSVHPGSRSVAKINGTECCEKCKKEIEAAVKKVDKHVEPKACFVWYEGNKTGWQPITGTGCAHWLAHERGIKKGSKSEQCMLGYPFRVKTAIGGKSAVALAAVAINDVYVSPSKDHAGLVVKVVADPKAPAMPKVTIRHDSSAQGKVSDNEFATYFKGRGSFLR